MLPLRGEGRAEGGGGRGLADAALEADDRDAVAGEHGRTDQLQLPLPLGLFLLAAELEPGTTGSGPAALGLRLGVAEKPVGGELDYLDEGTLAQALRARRPIA